MAPRHRRSARTPVPPGRDSSALTRRTGKALPPREGTIDDPTITVKTDTKTLDKLLQKKLNPLMAYAMKKIKVDGPMDDIMILKDFF